MTRGTTHPQPPLTPFDDVEEAAVLDPGSSRDLAEEPPRPATTPGVLPATSDGRPVARGASPRTTADRLAGLWGARNGIIAAIALAGIAAHLLLRFVGDAGPFAQRLPLLLVLGLGGGPLTLELLVKLVRRQFGSDLLAGISIVTSVLLGQELAGSLVVLMLSGGGALEAFAVRRASSVLRALARRMPSVAHRVRETRAVDIAIGDIRVGDTLVVLPHEICPVDATVVDGHGWMDESYLTGEPFHMSKAPGSDVLSGAINGEHSLTIRATRLPIDSRYARIMEVVRRSEEDPPRIRRLGDQLGALYTPLALVLAGGAWLASGHAERFLAVLVVATPCPLLIAIPVAIIGSISLSARRGIIIRKAAILEQVDGCRTLIFDKTGTLTYGEPNLSEMIPAPGVDRARALVLAASLERYSKHPLARAVLAAAARERIEPPTATQISERAGEGLRGVVDGAAVQITSRSKALAQDPGAAEHLPPLAGGLECVLLVDGRYVATFRFRDEPRTEGASFVGHLRPRHRVDRLMLVSGDREPEVRYLAGRVGIREVYAGQTPEQKLEIVRRETSRAKTLFLGDGINDAPALLAATVGVALGQRSDVTTEAAGAVIMDSSLTKVDEFLHIGRRMKRIALQSAVGGMALSVVGMVLAATGHLSPVAGAVAQEVIDLVAVANALRVAIPPRELTDF
jgi:heavy metal translocating P-type ATPase